MINIENCKIIGFRRKGEDIYTYHYISDNTKVDIDGYPVLNTDYLSIPVNLINQPNNDIEFIVDQERILENITNDLLLLGRNDAEYIIKYLHARVYPYSVELYGIVTNIQNLLNSKEVSNMVSKVLTK